MMILRAFICLFLAIYATDAYAWEKFKTETIFKHSLDNDSMPADVIFEKNGQVTIYDSFRGAVTSYNKANEQITSYVGLSMVGGNCLVADADGLLFCDREKGQLAVLGDDHKAKYVIRAIEKGVKLDPTDVIRIKDNLYIVDNDNHRVLVYDTKVKKIIQQIGKQGVDTGYMRYPYSIAADKDGFLFVTEVLNTRVQMLSASYKSVLNIGSWGVKPGQFYRPTGLALYGNKYVLVSDGYLGVIQIFDLRGKFVGVIADSNGVIKRFEVPTKIRISGDRLAVVDTYGRNVEILDIGGLK